MCHEHRGHAGGCCCEGGGCGPDFPFRRRFPTRAERIARLEEYLQVSPVSGAVGIFDYRRSASPGWRSTCKSCRPRSRPSRSASPK